jgi:hypothetical protein
MDGYYTFWQEINIQECFSLAVFPEIPPSSFVLQNYLMERNNQRPTQSVPVFHLSNSIHVYFFIFLLRKSAGRAPSLWVLPWHLPYN